MLMRNGAWACDHGCCRVVVDDDYQPGLDDDDMCPRPMYEVIDDDPDAGWLSQWSWCWIPPEKVHRHEEAVAREFIRKLRISIEANQ